jgi:hypothetical protein
MRTSTFVAGALAATTLLGLTAPVAQADPVTAAERPAPVASKPAVFRDGAWFLRNTATTGVADVSFVYGLPGDAPFMGDWDGNGTKTPGVYRHGVFYLRNENSTGVADITLSYGVDRPDWPVVGDWNGDGIDTVGVFRIGEARWYLRNENTSGVADVTFSYGIPEDFPEVGDWDGDGVDTPAVVRAPDPYDCDNAAGEVIERNSNTTGVGDVTPDLPKLGCGRSAMVGDFDGDGSDEITVHESPGPEWHTAAGTFVYGLNTDTPLSW